MKSKKQIRLRRAAKGRRKIKELADVARLCVNKTAQHIYCQIISPDGSKTLACASSLDKKLRSDGVKNGNKEAAARVGKLIGELALKSNVKKVAFDRSGFKYHGRVKVLADSAREAGLEF